MPILVLFLVIAVPVLLSWPLGWYMARILEPSPGADGWMAKSVRLIGGGMVEKEQE